jgi:hypothetical protein
VLNFLRDGSERFAPPTDAAARRELYFEACHYSLWDLALIIQDAYPGAPLPGNEAARLLRLESLDIMHTDDADIVYDNLTKVVQILLNMPIVLISLVGGDHQWFKSRCGLDATETPKNTSFCAFSFLTKDPQVFVVEDAVSDPRTSSNPLVIGEPFIGFYAGCPLVTPDGFRLGALCVIDHVPRKLTRWQYQVLVNFGYIAVREIHRRELEKIQDPIESASIEEIDKRASDSAAVRRQSWRNQVWKLNYGSGALRTSRMKEGLSEVTCVVQVNTKNMVWPILYANQNWTLLTSAQIRPPHFKAGLDNAGCPDTFEDQSSLWDFLQLDTGTESSAFLGGIRSMWEGQAEPHTFGVVASLMTVPADMCDASKEVLCPVSCRFVPVQQSLDVAAAAVDPVPPVSLLEASARCEGKPAESCLYFVVMVVVDDASQDCSAKAEPVAADMSPTDSTGFSGPPGGWQPPDRQESGGTDPDSGDKKRQVSSGGGSSRSGGVQLKPTRPPFVDVQLREKVGQGSFGKVYYAQWLGSPVAVKVIDWKGKTDAAKTQFEAELSCTLSHPNLVQTYKYSTREHSGKKKELSQTDTGVVDGVGYQTWIVQEWCDAGTLRTLCNRPRNEPRDHVEVLQICSEIASAGSYLHSRGIIHGDLTANNVLCKTQVSVKGYVCKICDFGLARILEGESNGILTNQLGTVTHMPPELFHMDRQIELTTKADVYAAGVLLWQTVCGVSPWKGLPAPTVVVQVASGKRLKMPEGTPEHITDIFASCTKDEPEDRPTMDELSESLHQALEHLDDADAGDSVSSA